MLAASWIAVALSGLKLKAHPELVDGPPNSDVNNLAAYLRRVRDRSREAGPNDVYIDLVEICEWCDAIVVQNAEQQRTAEADTVFDG